MRKKIEKNFWDMEIIGNRRKSISRHKDKAFEDKKLGTFNNSQMDVEYFHLDMTGKVRNLILNHSL